MLNVLDWCVVCTGLVCCMYWTSVLYVLDWCVAKGYQNISASRLMRQDHVAESPGHEYIHDVPWLATRTHVPYPLHTNVPLYPLSLCPMTIADHLSSFHAVINYC